MMIALIIIMLLQQIAIMWLFLRNARGKAFLTSLKQRVDDSRRYVGMLLETVYTHKHRPQHLLEHLLDEMTVDKLLCYHLVSDDFSNLFPRRFSSNKRDMLIYKLSLEGFTPKQLCLLFQLNNLNSVYVKCCRINKKLHPEEQADKTT